MFGCFNAATVRASFKNLARSRGLSAISERSFFSATVRCKPRSTASYTTPMPPWPSVFTIRNPTGAASGRPPRASTA